MADSKYPNNVPIGVKAYAWIVAVFYLLATAFIGLIGYIVLTGVIEPSPSSQAFYDGLDVQDYVGTVLISALSISGSVAFVLMRRIALKIFLAALFLNCSLFIWNSVARGLVDTLENSILIGGWFGIALHALICMALWKYERRGLLR